MKENLLKIINRAALALILLLAFLQPLFFLPLFTDVFDLPKTLLLYCFVASLLLLLALRWLLTGIKIYHDRFLFVLILLGGVAAFSSLLGPGRLTSSLYGLPPFLALVLLYFLALQFFAAGASFEGVTFSEKVTPYQKMLYTLLASGSILALWRLFSFFQIYPPLAGDLGNLLQNRAFTPLGSGLSLTLYLTMLFPLALGLLLEGVTFAAKVTPFQNGVLRSLFSVLYLLTAGLALILTAPWWALVLVALPVSAQLFFTPHPVLRAVRYQLLSVTTILLLVTVLFHVPLNLNNQLLKAVGDFPRDLQPGLRTSWIVAVNTVRDYPLLGTGLGTFASDFARFRPLDYNLTPVWFIRFGTSSNYVFQLLTTLGLIGTGIYLLFATSLIRQIGQIGTGGPEGSAAAVPSGLIFAILAFFLGHLFAVPSVAVLSAFILLLAAFSATSGRAASQKHNLLPSLLFVPLLFLSIAVLYLAVRLGYGEGTFRQALQNVREQKAVDGFNLLQRTLAINPYRDNYRLAAASLSFSLADQAAARVRAANYSLLPDPKEAAPSTNISNDRALLMQLLDYAVKEAKNAVTLDPYNVDNWESLASIYRNVSGFVQNAADWSLNTYRQAIAVDPINPLLRLDIGGLFYLAGDFENAGNFFRDAVLLKNDLPNARYNLAWAYRQKGLIGAAVNEMTVVTRLVPLESPDYKKANDELEQFKKLLPPPAPPSGGETEEPKELKVETPSAELAQPKPQKVALPEASPSAR